MTPIMLGGPGVVVQIEKSLFVHSQKVNLKYNCCIYFSFVFTQNGRGLCSAQQQWIFGMVDISTGPSVVLELVQVRTATLTSIISAHVTPGTVIWSDQWSSYRDNRVAFLPSQSICTVCYRYILTWLSVSLPSTLSQQVEYTPTILRVTKQRLSG